jgi:hypothetical protein
MPAISSSRLRRIRILALKNTSTTAHSLLAEAPSLHQKTRIRGGAL